MKKLRSFCTHPHIARQHHTDMDVAKYTWDALRPHYTAVIDSEL